MYQILIYFLEVLSCTVAWTESLLNRLQDGAFLDERTISRKNDDLFTKSKMKMVFEAAIPLWNRYSGRKQDGDTRTFFLLSTSEGARFSFRSTVVYQMYRGRFLSARA